MAEMENKTMLRELLPNEIPWVSLEGHKLSNDVLLCKPGVVFNAFPHREVHTVLRVCFLAL